MQIRFNSVYPFLLAALVLMVILDSEGERPVLAPPPPYFSPNEEA
jgi:hypothetical protein